MQLNWLGRRQAQILNTVYYLRRWRWYSLEVANGLMGSRAVLGVLPAGTEMILLELLAFLRL